MTAQEDLSAGSILAGHVAQALQTFQNHVVGQLVALSIFIILADSQILALDSAKIFTL